MKSLLSKLAEPLVYDIIKEENVVLDIIKNKNIQIKGNYVLNDHGFSPISEETTSTPQENIPYAFPINT